MIFKSHGPDFYKSLACELFSVTYDKVTREQRYAAKISYWRHAYGEKIRITKTQK